jgi:hypothetical protein
MEDLKMISILSGGKASIIVVQNDTDKRRKCL